MDAEVSDNSLSLSNNNTKNKEGKLIGNSADIVKSISRFLNNEEMSDIVLKLGQQKYHAHRFVLVLMSDVFQALCSQRWNGNSINEVELNECEQCIPVFPVFLHFLYHGSVYVNTSTALPLLMLADKYNVQPLKLSCEDYVQSQIKDGNVVGAIRWLPYLQLCAHRQLEKSCLAVIAIEMDFVLGCNDFLLLTLEFLLLLLTRDDLVLSCEYTLYTGVLKWLDAHDGGNEAQSHVMLEAVLPHIRFAMMLPDQLIEVENSEFFRQNRDAIQPYVAIAHRFRSLAAEVTDESFAGSPFQPRNYTNSLWCHYINLNTVAVENPNRFNPKSTTSHIAHQLVMGAPTEAVWHIEVLNGIEKAPRPMHVQAIDYEQAQWRFVFGPSNNMAASNGDAIGNGQPASNVQSSPSGIPLLVSVRPIRPLRPNVAVDISLFLVKKDRVCKLLDSATIVSSKSASDVVAESRGLDGGKFRAVPATSSSSSRPLRDAQSSPRLFQPSPMHFAFIPPHQPQPSAACREPEVFLKYRFTKEQLEMPPEAPCVSFGPRFASVARPSHSAWIAVVTKPRIRTDRDDSCAPADHDDSVAPPDGDHHPLPLFG